MSDFNIHTFQTTVIQDFLPQPSLLVGARSRGKFAESRFWQRLSLNLQRTQFGFLLFFFLKNIFIPFCHRVSRTMFIFPFQVIVYGLFIIRYEKQAHFFPFFLPFLTKFFQLMGAAKV